MKKTAVFIVLLTIACSFAYSIGNPDKIVSLAPNITEIIYALDCSENLVGRSEQCNYPPQCKDIENVGNPWKPNIEKILMLKPDIVLASSLTDDQTVEALNKAGINTYKINYEDSFDGVYSTIESIGRVLGQNDKALNLNNSIKDTISYIKTKTDTLQTRKKAAYLMSWSNGNIYAATGNTFIDGILQKAGLDNIAKDAKYWVISKELLVKEAPDIIFVPSYNSKTSEIKRLKKLVNSDIVVINGDAIERQGVRTKDITLELSKSAYPKLYK